MLERKRFEGGKGLKLYDIVLISNAPENYSDRKLIETYKGQQVVENLFRELKSPSMASVIYLKNPRRIKALSMLLTFSLLVRAII